MILLTLGGLIYSKGFGSTEDSVLYNLGTLPEADEILRILLDIAHFLQEEVDNGKGEALVNNLDPRLIRGVWDAEHRRFAAGSSCGLCR